MKMDFLESFLWAGIPQAALDLLPNAVSSRNTLEASLQRRASRPLPDRAELSRSLRTYNQQVGGSVAGADALGQTGTVAVITGQQAGLFSGPLYTLHKTLTAINLANRLQKTFGRRVVPIFWHATEDHDMSEIRDCRFPERLYRADFPLNGQAAESLRSADCISVREALLADLAGSPQVDAIAAALTIDHATYGEYASSVIARMLPGMEPVILEPKLLRPGAREFFRQCIKKRKGIRQALQAGGEEMRRCGLSPAFSVDDDALGLFYLNSDGRRRHIRHQANRFQVSGDWIREADLLQRVEDEPESFSTGAWLRPVLQSWILPDAVYVAGPGEFRYHLQLRRVYACFELIPPFLFPRNHATIFGSREIRLVQALGLAPSTVLGLVPEDLYHRDSLPPERRKQMISAAEKLAHAVRDVEQGTAELLPPQTLAAFSRNLERELERIQQKAEKAWRRQSGIDNGRIDRLFNCIRPGNVPQERRISPWYFIAEFGLGWVQKLAEILDPEESRHYLLTPKKGASPARRTEEK